MEHHIAWGLPVVIYLFLAGVGAGAVTVSGSVFLRGGGSGNKDMFSLARYGALIGPIPVIIGTICIIFELGRWDRALNLFKVINLSPMSIGSWFLGLFITTSLLYAAAFLPSMFRRFDPLAKRMEPALHALAWINVPLGIGVAVYTGVLLGAMPSRPLWNSPILAFLFLISALSTGIATMILARTVFHREPAWSGSSGVNTEHGYHEGGYLLTASDLMLIGFELLVIFLFLMFAHLTIGNLKYAIAVILPGGEMAGTFWFWVVLVGLLLPGLIELFYVIPRLIYKKEFNPPRGVEFTVSLAVLVGGFMLRYVIVIAGQLTWPRGI